MDDFLIYWKYPAIITVQEGPEHSYHIKYMFNES